VQGGNDAFEWQSTRLQQHQQVEQQVCGLVAHFRLVSRSGGKGSFHAFLADFLRYAARAFFRSRVV
jgi:hypothetical protein